MHKIASSKCFPCYVCTQYFVSCNIVKKCNIVLLGISLSESCHFCQSHFCHFRFWKYKNSSIKNIYINIFIYIFFIEHKMCFWFWKWQKWLWQKWQGLPQPVFDTVCANLVIFLCFITSWYSVWKLKIWALFSTKSEQTIAKSCFLLYFCRRKTCTRQFESSFHCARLHFLCRRKTCTHAPARSSIKTKGGHNRWQAPVVYYDPKRC